MQSRPQILISGALIWADFRKLYPQFEFLVLDSSANRDSFISDCKDGQFANIQGIYRHNTSADWIGVFDAELIAALPQSLKVIGHNGAGYDQIDIKACTSRGILVSNTPTAVDDATATTAMFLLLSCFRQYWPSQLNVRDGRFKAGMKPAHDPENKVLGIVGMGGIGSAIARRAQGFGMKVHYHNRKPISAEKQQSFSAPVHYEADLDELLKKADAVALSMPLNAQTEGFFDKEKFTAMKDGAIFVNTARGAIVDEEALIEALDSGKLSSIGLDVYPNEPEINSRLIANSRATLLPHVGTETVESQCKMEVRALDNLKSFFDKGEVEDLVIEQRNKAIENGVNGSVHVNGVNGLKKENGLINGRAH